MMRPAAAMVMAAGRGQRMRPLSDVLPKPALPILDRPLLQFALAQAAGSGVSRLVVNAWHLAEHVERAARDSRGGPRHVAVSREPELLGGAGGLALARDRGLLGEEGPVMVLNGDVLLGLDLAPLLERHVAGDDLVSLALLPHPGSGRWSRVRLGPRGVVEAIVPPAGPESSRGDYLYTGVMMVARDALDALPGGAGEIAERLWWPARRAGRLGAVVVKGTWWEVGTPVDYLEAVIARLEGGSWTDPSARVAPSSLVVSSAIGRGCVVGAGAVVERSVLARGVTVEAGATVLDSVVLGRAVVRSGQRCTGEFLVAPL